MHMCTLCIATPEVAQKKTIDVLQCIASLPTCCIAGRLREVPGRATAESWHGTRISRDRNLHKGWNVMVI